MNIRTVEAIEKWIKLKAALINNDYKLFQMQYSAKQEEGFHCWFIKGTNQTVEVVTHNIKIEQDIIKSNMT